ncbi:MAG TPA: hypothetical protein VLL69_18440 [Streptosporangiaceae bacterium]|nr:hypothetical protein [Streptosporangiaceae bacterium]
MYRRTGSEYNASVNPGSPGPAVGTMVLSICGGTSIDMVARSRWSRSRSAQNASDRPGPATSRSCRRFFTQCDRCHCADSHCAAVTPAQPGKRRQSGSVSSLR